MGWDFMSRKLFFNSILRALLEAYLKFCISTFISVKSMRFDTASDILNCFITFLFVIFVLGFPLFVGLFLRKHKAELQANDFKGRY